CVRLAGKYVHTRPFPFKAINLIQESANRVLLQRLSIPGEVGEIQITPADIVQVVSTKTKIPPEDLMEDSLFNERRFVERLREQIVGQDVAIETVCQRVAGYKMGLLDPNKPWGVFLFVGPTGVGKTELAKNLAKLLFNDEKSLICIDGSEYKESHTLSNLIGSPLGYEGHDTGGLLTEPLLKNPHQIVLLDEFEKFHEDVRRLFLQVFDRGTLTDRRGKSVDCTHALFIMTSNIGSDKLFELCQHGELNVDEVGQVLKPILVESLSAELCNRFTGVVPFQPLKKEHLPDVVVVQLNRIKERLASQAHINLVWTPELVRHFVEMDVDLSFGMRDFCRHVDSEVVRVLKNAGCLNDRRLQGKVTLTFKDDQFGVKLLKGGSRG
ncbi:MAG: AAA family ATPase, partial [Waddliaceae bacterium]